MEEQELRTEAGGPAASGELVRPVEGRILVGVAQGLANRYRIPVWLIRLGFVLLTLAGGLGLALYAAGWILVRSEDEPEPPAARVFSDVSSGASWIGIGLVFLAMVILLENLTFLDGRVVWAVALLVIGVLLYTGDLPRLARSPRGNPPEATKQVVPAAETGSVPPPPTPPRLPERVEPSHLGRLTVGVALVASGILAVLDNVPGLPFEPGPRHYLALILTVIGLGLLAGAFIGRARWLILLGILLIPTAFFSPVFEYDIWDGDVRFANALQATVVPQTFEELEQAYRVDVGSLRVDLTDLPWEGQSVALDLAVDAGNLTVFVPEGIAVSGSASADVGRVWVMGRESAGFGSPQVSFDEPGSQGRLEIEARVDAGNIEIFRSGS